MLTIDEVYVALSELGAPVTSCEDLERLYQGRMAELLDFVATNLPGRQRAAAARGTIQTYRERERSHTTFHEEIDPLYDRVQRANASVKTSQAALKQLEATREKQASKIGELEEKEEALQSQVEQERLTALLLKVLERKEEIRKARFAEILRLLEELRQKMREAQTPCDAKEEPLHSSDEDIKVPRAEYTRDALAALQAHSLRLSRLSALAKDGGLKAKTRVAEARLLDLVARSKGSNRDDPEVAAAYQRCLAAAKSRAALSVQYRSPLPTEDEHGDVEGLSDRVTQKEFEVQSLADHASALTLACARAIQANAAFATESVPQLREALQKEASAAQGHVDTLRLSIVNHADKPETTQTYRHDRTLHHGRSFSQTLADIDRLFGDTRETERFLGSADQLLSPDPVAAESHHSISASYSKAEAETSEKIRRLLERKAAKADAGRVLVEDIERLVGEPAIIASSSWYTG
ncbi:hypothetical protein FKP32DRAFT_1596976 [Trametes sanguinea]|nr:hypothetical protein FKP32DRAFT_1596976 [Trametes sanguinea]